MSQNCPSCLPLQKAAHLGIDRALEREHFAGFLARRDCLQALRRLRRTARAERGMPDVAVADESRAAQAARSGPMALTFHAAAATLCGSLRLLPRPVFFTT